MLADALIRDRGNYPVSVALGASGPHRQAEVSYKYSRLFPKLIETHILLWRTVRLCGLLATHRCLSLSMHRGCFHGTMLLFKLRARWLIISFILALSSLPSLVSGTSKAKWTTLPKPVCRYVPEDAEWPSASTWRSLNETVGGNLLLGVPLAQPCYSNVTSSGQSCQQIRDEWTELSPR